MTSAWKGVANHRRNEGNHFSMALAAQTSKNR